MDAPLLPLVETLWNYHLMHQDVRPAGAILVLCSHDRRVAERGAQLVLDGFAPLLIFSGGLGSITRRMWQAPEADQFAAIAASMGVPPDRLLVENRSTNTGESVRFTRDLLASRALDPGSFILVQKPYMERRAYATFRKIWPDKPVTVTSPRVSMEEYLREYSTDALSVDEVISIMVGDLQRIRVYAEKGFQIPQDIPADVREAYDALVRAGYDSRLI